MIASLTQTLQEFSIDPAELVVDRKLLERILGYDKSPTPEPVVSFLDGAIHRIPELVTPRCALQILPPGSCAFNKRAITVSGIEFHTQPIISKRLSFSDSLAFFVCTIGSQLELESRQLMDEGHMLEGFLLDQIGSEVVEQAANWVERKLAEIVAPMNWKITNRYSPGYCKWSVAEQHNLFSFFPKEVCGITLTESSLMIPIKSVSGVIGIGPRSKRMAYECSVCDMTDCYRRKD